MHGMGFMQINEWAWWSPEPAMTYACLMLRNGIAAIIGVRSDIGVDTESGARHIVASELGLKYEDTVIHETRSDNSSFYMWQPGGSFSTSLHHHSIDHGRKRTEEENPRIRGQANSCLQLEPLL